MIFLIVFGFAAMCWVPFGVRRFQVSGISPMMAGMLGVLFSGIILGHDFFNTNVGPLPITIDRILLAVLCGVFAIRFALRKENLVSLDVFDICVVGWFGLIAYSTFTHDYSFQENMPISRLLFFNFLPLCFYFVIKHSQFKRADLSLVLVAFVLLGVYLALTGIAENREWTWAIFPRHISDPTITEFLGRARGPLLNPVINGMLLSVAAVSGFFLMVNPARHPFAKVGLFLVCGLISVGALLTFTRSIWLGLALAGSLVVFLQLRSRQRILFTSILVLGSILGVMLLKGGLEFGFKRDKHVTIAEMRGSADLRTVFFVIAQDMFVDRPVMGFGFGQYMQERTPYVTGENAAGVQIRLGEQYLQHNVFLNYLVEMGLVGLFALLIVLGGFGYLGSRVWLDDRLPLVARQIGLLIVAFLCTYLFNGMFHDVSIIPMTHMLLFALAGLVASIYHNRERWAAAEAEGRAGERSTESGNENIVTESFANAAANAMPTRETSLQST